MYCWQQSRFYLHTWILTNVLLHLERPRFRRGLTQGNLATGAPLASSPPCSPQCRSSGRLQHRVRTYMHADVNVTIHAEYLIHTYMQKLTKDLGYVEDCLGSSILHPYMARTKKEHYIGHYPSFYILVTLGNRTLPSNHPQVTRQKCQYKSGNSVNRGLPLWGHYCGPTRRSSCIGPEFMSATSAHRVEVPT